MKHNPINQSTIKLYYDAIDLLKDPTIDNRKELINLIDSIKPFIRAYNTKELINDIIRIYGKEKALQVLCQVPKTR